MSHFSLKSHQINNNIFDVLGRSQEDLGRILGGFGKKGQRMYSLKVMNYCFFMAVDTNTRGLYTYASNSKLFMYAHLCNSLPNSLPSLP